MKFDDELTGYQLSLYDLLGIWLDTGFTLLISQGRNENALIGEITEIGQDYIGVRTGKEGVFIPINSIKSIRILKYTLSDRIAKDNPNKKPI